MRPIGGAIVLEQVLVKPFERNRTQKAGRHDPVGVDVVAAQRETAAGDRCDCRRRLVRLTPRMVRLTPRMVRLTPRMVRLKPRMVRLKPRMVRLKPDSTVLVCHAGTSSSFSRTSTTSPAIAAAATIAGLMSSVRPVGLPWRPLKFRLDDEAQIWRPSSR